MSIHIVVLHCSLVLRTPPLKLNVHSFAQIKFGKYFTVRYY
jgi:hypothetical protein